MAAYCNLNVILNNTSLEFNTAENGGGIFGDSDQTNQRYRDVNENKVDGEYYAIEFGGRRIYDGYAYGQRQKRRWKTL